MSAKTLGDELHDEQAQAAYEREMERRKAATLNALDYVIEHFGELYVDGFQRDNARAELAALRATITESCALIDTLNTTIAEQARQLEQAREIIERQYTGTYRTYTERRDAMIAWLAANAPAPQAQTAQRVTAEDERMWDE